MYQKVQAYLTLHAPETVSVPAVATLKSQLDARVTALLGFAVAAGADYTGATVDKQNRRKDLKAKVLKVSGPLVAFAAMNNSMKLLEKVDETPAAMDNMRDNDFYTYARTVAAEAALVSVASLTPFGMVAADLTALNTSAAAYLAAIQDPRLLSTERSKANLDIEKTVDEIDSLLYDKLDKVMGAYAATNASLLEGYRLAHTIDDTGSAEAPDYELVIAESTLFYIADFTPWQTSRGFRFQNTGSVPLTFVLSTSGTEISGSGTPLTIAPGQMMTRTMPALSASPTSTKLLVRNDDTITAGSFRLWVNE